MIKKSTSIFAILICLFSLVLSTKAEADTNDSFYTEINISAAGDCTLGTDKYFATVNSFPEKYNEVNNPSYFLSGVLPIFENDDLTIVNLEGTLTTNGERVEKDFSFRGDPKYVEILNSGSVEACNLANNHSYDYGEISYTDTIMHVENANIKTFGLGRTAVYEVKGKRIGLVGVYELPYGIRSKETLIKDMDAVKAEGVDLLICSFHWGIERAYYPNDVQKELAHAAIDNGADLVLGHHPHVLQGIEKYRGKYIVYSLANFCFGGNRNPSDKDTMVFTQTFTFDGDELVKPNVSRGISGELSLLKQKENGFIYDLKADGVNVYPCSVSSVSTKNDYQPTILEGEEGIRVMNKIIELSAPFN